MASSGTLAQLVKNIQYDDDWEIWADVPFTPESEARYGQRQFENGGVLDEKTFFATGTRCGDFIAEWCEGDEDVEDEAVNQFIDEVEEERKDAVCESAN